MFNILLSAGEASGDLHAAKLVNDIKKDIPNTYFCGMGGNLMHDAGVDILIDSKDMSIIGGIEILTHSLKIIKAMRTMKNALKTKKISLVILVDYPGFNLWLAKVAKQAGIKVLYYISPQIWAWHQSRIIKIKKYVDFMAVFFPFETKFYEKAQVPVGFVGHPLAQTVYPTMPKETAKAKFQLDTNKLTIGLFPGSRKGEIKRLFPVMLNAAILLQKQYPNIQFILPLALTLTNQDLEQHLQRHPELKVTIIKNYNYDVANVCDAIIATSGTVTLEIGILAIPMVIIYKMAPFNYFFAKRLIKVDFIGLCNIVAEEKVAPELIQEQATAENVFAEINQILQNESYRKTMINKLSQIREKLINQPNKINVIEVIKKLLQQL